MPQSFYSDFFFYCLQPRATKRNWLPCTQVQLNYSLILPKPPQCNSYLYHHLCLRYDVWVYISSISAFIGSGPCDDFRQSQFTMQRFYQSMVSLGSFLLVCRLCLRAPWQQTCFVVHLLALWMIGAAIQLPAQNRAQLIIGRIIGGFGIGPGLSGPCVRV